jgi:hypothetical protein
MRPSGVHAAAAALDQQNAQDGFQLLQPRAQGRLGHRALTGGAAEMAGFDQRDQIPQLAGRGQGFK